MSRSLNTKRNTPFTFESLRPGLLVVFNLQEAWSSSTRGNYVVKVVDKRISANGKKIVRFRILHNPYSFNSFKKLIVGEEKLNAKSYSEAKWEKFVPTECLDAVFTETRFQPLPSDFFAKLRNYDTIYFGVILDLDAGFYGVMEHAECELLAEINA